MGIIALAQGKRVHLFDKKNIRCKTYTQIYNVLFENGYPVINDLKSLFSSNYSGLVYYKNNNPKKNIDNFYHRAWVIKNGLEIDNICEECKKEDVSVKQNLIVHSYKICNICNLTRKIFPI